MAARLARGGRTAPGRAKRGVGGDAVCARRPRARGVAHRGATGSAAGAKAPGRPGTARRLVSVENHGVRGSGISRYWAGGSENGRRPPRGDIPAPFQPPLLLVCEQPYASPAPLARALTGTLKGVVQRITRAPYARGVRGMPVGFGPHSRGAAMTGGLRADGAAVRVVAPLARRGRWHGHHGAAPWCGHRGAVRRRGRRSVGGGAGDVVARAPTAGRGGGRAPSWAVRGASAAGRARSIGAPGAVEPAANGRPRRAASACACRRSALARSSARPQASGAPSVASARSSASGMILPPERYSPQLVLPAG